MLGLLTLMVIGCATTTNVHKLTEQERKDAAIAQARSKKMTSIRRQLDYIHTLIEQGRINEAEIRLAPLSDMDLITDDMDFFLNEIDMLENTIANARKLKPFKAQATIDQARTLQETEEKLALPSSYGKMVVIDAKLPPLELPPGPMETLVNKKVSIQLDSAGIAELVNALKEVCKINVIADDALQSEKTLTIAVEDVPLKEILSYISRNMGVSFHMGHNMIWITASEVINNGPLLETRIIRLRQGALPTVPSGPGAPGAKDGGAGSVENKEDNELEEVLAAFMADSPEGSTFRIFRDRNILVIRDTRENLKFAEELIKEFDKPPYQVVIEARFITVSKDDLRDVGTEITQQTPINYHDPASTEAIKTVNMLTSLGALKQGAENGVGLVNFSGVIANRTFDILVSALDKKASTVTLSVPKVTVMNNRQARIRKGDKLYYFEEYDVETIDGGDSGDSNLLVPSGTPTELPIGLTFDVKVNVGNDGRTVLLGLKPELVEFKGWESYLTTGGDDDDDDSSSSSGEGALSQIKLPRTYEQSVITTVGVSSGHTVVLGGMLENKKTKTVKQVPLLGDIPLLGYLFKHEEITKTPVSLLIFITATVINDKGEYLDVLPENAAGQN